MNILVTGGLGFIGTHLTDWLKMDGHHVRVYDSLEPQVHTKGQPHSEADEVIIDSMTHTMGVYNALKDIDVVFHFAAQVGVGQSMYQPLKYVRDNCLGTAVLLECMQKVTPKKLIVASSMSIYGRGYRDSGVVEASKLRPTSVYATTKRDQEEMCLQFGKTHNIPVWAPRFFNVYGEGQSLSNPYTGVAAIFASRLMNDKPPIIFGDGTQGRDFIYISDIVKGLLLMLYRDVKNYQSVNLCTGEKTTIKDLAVILAAALDKDIKPEITGKERAGDIHTCYGDYTRARDMLRYEPTINIYKGMKRYAKWLRNQEAEDKTDNALSELKKNALLA